MKKEYLFSAIVINGFAFIGDMLVKHTFYVWQTPVSIGWYIGTIIGIILSIKYLVK